ncbi:hypothetical protein DMB95_00235 [Campylobacter sp. MIT 12-8780]|uniref:hypothetical protein n=1 Tax=unclassified Campylobacter TaxID=2593542 RepID=UPI00115D5EBE|nr:MULTISPECIES: hypothetical protein [unclassified Campylobacter]NDJ26388.1 hypothetical protein [Campylobacter sp. MIT 19-121]TQR42964.1 hypothetical protein DMB95_00235 [Campylobacter sp. MIT 12-8780]
MDKENLNSTQNKKYDENGDEIIWEYKEDKMWFHVAVVVNMIAIYGFYWLTINKVAKWVNPGFGHYMSFLFIFLLMAAYPLYSIFRLFNQKAVYATKDKLIFKRYLGKPTILSLELPIYTSNYISRLPHSTTDFYILGGERKFFDRKAYIIYGMEDESIDELRKNILLPRVKEYVLNIADEKEALTCILILSMSDFNKLIDLKALENERLERLKNTQ